jgi:hypothetical protein
MQQPRRRRLCLVVRRRDERVLVDRRATARVTGSHRSAMVTKHRGLVLEGVRPRRAIGLANNERHAPPDRSPIDAADLARLDGTTTPRPTCEMERLRRQACSLGRCRAEAARPSFRCLRARLRRLPKETGNCNLQSARETSRRCRQDLSRRNRFSFGVDGTDAADGARHRGANNDASCHRAELFPPMGRSSFEFEFSAPSHVVRRAHWPRLISSKTGTVAAEAASW